MVANIGKQQKQTQTGFGSNEGYEDQSKRGCGRADGSC